MTSADGRERLLIIGGGPKAVAMAAKTAVLRELGFATPELTIVERREVGAHWSGRHGLTDGEQELGTPPEKDVGFPYASTAWGELSEQVNARMLAFSWSSFLVRTQRYARWIDRGRPPPRHSVWSEYLRWALAETGITPTYAEVTSLDIEGKTWRVGTRTAAGHSSSMRSDVVVLTGVGGPVRIPGEPIGDPRILDMVNFWKNTDAFRDARGLRVAVIGAGESAAAVTQKLLRCVGSDATIHHFAVRGCSYSRGESATENSVYTDPSGWTALTEGDRQEFINRTDRGVMSVAARSTIDLADNVVSEPGFVERIERGDAGVDVELTYAGRSSRRSFDYAVVAIGLDPLWFTDLLTKGAETHVFSGVERPQDIARAVGRDLAVQDIKPRLHLPQLAGLSQGPGFPNLSCLGLMSDRILAAYVSRAARGDAREPAPGGGCE